MIMSISRKYQYGVWPHTDDITDFEKTEKAFDKEQAKVYYFGVPGTHTQQAMEDVFGEAVQGISCQSFQGVRKLLKTDRQITVSCQLKILRRAVSARIMIYC